MPVPMPEAGETQDQFVSRCMSAISGEYEEEQALGICHSQWRGERSQSRSVMPYLVYTKSRGAWQQQVLAGQDLCDWFRDHIDSKGVVQEPILLYEKANLKPAEDGLYPWTLSDFSVDRDMERIDPVGWDLGHYKMNPVVLWSHDYSRPAIGVMQDLVINPDSLQGKVKFSSGEVDPFAGMIEGKVKEGIIKSGSVGFMSNKIELINEEGNPTRLIHRKQTLIEFSICNIPTNINATMQPQLELSRGLQAAEVPEGMFEEITRQAKGDSYIAWLLRDRKEDGFIAKLLEQESRATSGLKNLFEERSEKNQHIGESNGQT